MNKGGYFAIFSPPAGGVDLRFVTVKPGFRKLAGTTVYVFRFRSSSSDVSSCNGSA